MRRYRKIYDEVRGDLGGAPFTKSGSQPHIHWVNIWDETDIISGPLQSPAAATGTEARIDNIHTNSLAHFNPGKAYGAYFDNYSVIKILFRTVFENQGNYRSENLDFRLDEQGQKKGLDYRAVDFGPGRGRGTWRLALMAAFTAPWVWLAYIVASMIGAEAVSGYILWAAIAISALPVIGFLPRFFVKGGLADPLV